MAITLVLLPGLDGTGILFEPLLNFLSSSISPLIIPLPNDRPLGYDALVPIVRPALPQDGQFVLLGESFSGPLALMLAASSPANLKAFLLCASFIRNPTYLPCVLQHIIGAWLFKISPLFIQAKALLAGHSSSQLRQQLRRAHNSVPAVVMAERIRSILRLTCKQELQNCPVPIGYIRGSLDRVVPKKNYNQILAVNSTVREYVVHAPHLVLQTQPRAAAVAIETFVKDIGLT